MNDTFPAGLYRTTTPLPEAPADIPADALVYVGDRPGRPPFLVRPNSNRNNRWYWDEPVRPLPSRAWLESLIPLPPEGFYTLPETLTFGETGRWLQNAIVQLGYNGAGQGILFVAEDHEAEPRNVLIFSDRGQLIDDGLLRRLVRAPILPIAAPPIAFPN